MYRYIYVCIYICIHLWICICIFIYICTYMYIYVYLYICICTYICVYIYIYIHISMHIDVVWAQMQLSIHWYVYSERSDARSWSVCKYMYISCSIPALRRNNSNLNQSVTSTVRIFRRILQSEILSHPTLKTHCRMNEISRRFLEFARSVKKGLGGEGASQTRRKWGG